MIRALGRLLRFGCLGGLVLAGVLAVRRLQEPPVPPQQILVLGGDLRREQVGAGLAAYSHLPVLVSGGSNPEYAHWLFDHHGVRPERLSLDYRARDTLENFTTVVDGLRQRGIRHVLLVTSTDHMDRALLVGRIVAGSRGIRLTPMAVPCEPWCRPEGRRKVWGDGLRAAVWVVSGRDLRAELRRRAGR